MDNVRPLCVDMDGTLIATDALWESLFLLLKTKPILLFRLPFWLLQGKASLKREISRHVDLNPALLPYREEVLSLLKAEKQAGRELVLASASEQKLVERVAQHVGIFSSVLASDGIINLSSHNKLQAIQHYSNGKGFDYIGNSSDDLPIWKESARAIIIHPTAWMLMRARRLRSQLEVIPKKTSMLKALVCELRPHQWVKNVLLFVPLIMAHRIMEGELLFKAAIAFGAFSLCASSVYVLNDLLDLEADRAHPVKRSRPFASGELPVQFGLLLLPVLLLAATMISNVFLPWTFTALLGLYLIGATAYSFAIKRLLILDVLVLAGLYTLRVLAGAVAVAVVISPWLLAFSMFLFLSLAFLKRYSELRLMRVRQSTHVTGRGYLPEDLELLQSLGSSSGYLSILVLALYTNSKEVTNLYHHPSMLWLVGPCLLYWLTRMWFMAHRGLMTDDPIVFAVKDIASYGLGLLLLGILFIASVPF